MKRKKKIGSQRKLSGGTSKRKINTVPQMKDIL